MTELRHKEKGLEIDGFVLEFRPDGKVLLISKTQNFHITLHPGRVSGMFDIHKTLHDSSAIDRNTHETLFSIGHSDLERLLWTAGPKLLRDFLALMRPIRLGWVARRRLRVEPIPTESDLAHVATPAKRGRWKVDSALLQEWLRPPEYLEEILERPDGAYCLFDCRRRPPVLFGILFSRTGPGRERRLFWLRYRDLRRFQRRVEMFLVKAYQQLREKPAEPLDCPGP